MNNINQKVSQDIAITDIHDNGKAIYIINCEKDQDNIPNSVTDIEIRYVINWDNNYNKTEKFVQKYGKYIRFVLYECDWTIKEFRQFNKETIFCWKDMKPYRYGFKHKDYYLYVNQFIPICNYSPRTMMNLRSFIYLPEPLKEHFMALDNYEKYHFPKKKFLNFSGTLDVTFNYMYQQSWI